MTLTTSPLLFPGFEPGLNAQHELVMSLIQCFFIPSGGKQWLIRWLARAAAQNCFLSQNSSSAAVFSPRLLRGEPGSCRNSLESLTRSKKASWVKEFSSPVGSTGLSVCQHAEATGIILPADWLLSTQEGRNPGRASKRQAVFFKERSFTLSASNYTMARPSLWCVSMCTGRLFSLSSSSFHFSVSPSAFTIISSSRSVCRLSLRSPHLQAVSTGIYFASVGLQGGRAAAELVSCRHGVWVQGGRAGESINMCQETQASTVETLSHSEKFLHFFKSKKILFFL